MVLFLEQLFCAKGQGVKSELSICLRVGKIDDL